MEKHLFKVVAEQRGEGKDKYTVYVLKGSVGFDWEQHRYTRMLADILFSNSEDVTVDIMDGARGKEIMDDNGGGVIMGPNRIELSNLLIQKRPIKRIKFSYGGVTLHELLRHLHIDGGIDSKVNTMRDWFLIKDGNESPFHVRGKRFNKNIKSTAGPEYQPTKCNK